MDFLSPVWLWMYVGAFLMLAELASPGFVVFFFGLGAASVAVLKGCCPSLPLWLQFALFLAVSVALLVATRPLARRMHEKVVPTNLDRVLHSTARVTETVDNERSTGAVYIDGKTWTARSEDGSVLAKDEMVEVVRMEGVKLFVRKKNEEV